MSADSIMPISCSVRLQGVAGRSYLHEVHGQMICI